MSITQHFEYKLTIDNRHLLYYTTDRRRKTRKGKGMLKKVLFIMICVFACTMVGCSTDENTSKIMMQELYGENKEIVSEYNSELSVKCHNGTFVGSIENAVISYKGIPYAKAPIGELRWKKAILAEENDSVYEAYYYGKAPIQSECESELGSYYKKGEDCLTLNVWTNTNNSSKNKPVMVFLHGGSYGWGATSDPLYDGYNLVKKFDDIILVTVEYRTGIMGFIDFSNVEGGEDYKNSGNLGLLDQVCALKWIQKNIAAFGGDASNVTVFGESAGAGSVSLLPLIEGTKGLFHRIIAESGSVALTYSTQECQNLTQMLLEKTGCTNMKELLALPETELIQVNEELNDYNNFPERDGIVLPLDLYAAYENGKTSDIDMLIGTNSDECRYWINEMGQYTDLIDGLTIYKHGMSIMYENNLKKIAPEDMQYVKTFMKMQQDKKVWNITEFYNEILFRVPAVYQAETHSKNGGHTYMYYWAQPGEDEMIGACHAIELSYVFNNLEQSLYTGNSVNPELADIVQNMWVNFARTGNPSTNEYLWDEYNPETKKTMILAENVRMEENFKEVQTKVLTPLLKYGFNGCYSQLSFNVPHVYKMVALVGIVIIMMVVLFAVVTRKVKKRNIK